MTEILRTQMFEPAAGSPDSPFDPATLIVIGAPLGSKLEQGARQEQREPGSAAARAQAVATRLGAPVCAYVRPTLHETLDRATYGSLQPKRFAQTVANASEQLAAYVAGQGDYRSIILSSNSGDGPFASQLLRGGIGDMEVSHFALTDPAGMRKQSVLGGLRRWSAYSQLSARQLPVDYPYEPYTAPPNLARSIILDMIGNALVWASAATKENLTYLAAERPEVATHLYFPEYTFNGTADAMQSLANELNNASPATRATPFEAFYKPGWWHGMFDHPGFIADAIRRVTGQPPARW